MNRLIALSKFVFVVSPKLCTFRSDVKLIPEDFQSLDKWGDKRLQKVRIILLTPKCSVSAVSNPVEFILQENGGTYGSMHHSSGVDLKYML